LLEGGLDVLLREVIVVVAAPDELARKNVKDALRQLIEGDGGPLMWPRISEAEQDSPDATCRKSNRFLRESVAGKTSD